MQSSGPATRGWWRNGAASLPPAVRATLYVIGIAVMLFGTWARAQALYLSVEVVIVFGLLLAVGYLLVLISRGMLRATGLVLLFLSVPELMRYYAYGATSNYAGVAAAIVLMAAGVACLMRATARETHPLAMSIRNKAN